MHIEILTIGDELLDGVIADTNAQWLGAFLLDYGIPMARSTSVRDEVQVIEQALREISARADICICTGGLGPTADDLTVDSLAAVLDAGMTFDEDVWADIRLRYGTKIPPSNNRRQARIPVGAKALRSSVGTAPGIQGSINDCSIFLFPGVPRELYWHAQTYLGPHLVDVSPCEIFKKTLRFTGIGESDLAEAIDTLSLPETVSLAYRTALPENHVRLTAGSADDIDVVAQRIAEHLQRRFIGFDETCLATAVLNICRARGLTLSTAESCTGGLIAAELTGIAGASKTFMGGIVSYSNEIKRNQLDVPAAILEADGAVSETCALAMAHGVATQLKTDIGISVTGIAGPGGGRAGKPVGTVCFGWYGPGLSTTHQVHFRGDRDRIRIQSMGFALDRIRREYDR
jgi:nicotinamide-nucleotide amidase